MLAAMSNAEARRGAPAGGWPGRPAIYEVNTAIWLADLSRAAGRRVTLADVPGPAWDAVTPAGTDAVWLMGVWTRSPAGLALANANAALQDSFRAALPDLRPDDVTGSPYCVRRYVADESFGGPEGLAAARAALAGRGIRLILDYVPNHVAPDHPWVRSHPGLFINGGESDIRAEPAGWMRADGHILAHGRDPYFPPWPDVVQLNAFSPAMRAATAQTLADIAGQCDGIRCDMAMLLTNQVFAKTWAGHAGPEPARGVLAGRHRRAARKAPADRAHRRGLLGHGVDAAAAGLRLLLRQAAVRPDRRRGHRGRARSPAGRTRLPVTARPVPGKPRRAAGRGTLPGDAGRAAAVAIATLPGAVLWHEGQFEGRRVHPPVFLSRRPAEPPDTALAGWYRRLLATVAGLRVRSGSLAAARGSRLA